MKNRNLAIVIVVFLAVVFGLFLGDLLSSRAHLKEQTLYNSLSMKGVSKIDELLSLIDHKYVDSLSIHKLSEDMMSDLTSKLDPHSVYIPASDLAAVNGELEDSFSGIGVQFNIQNDTVMVVSVISGGPSEKAGLLAGDRIVTVNDTAFTGKKITNEKVIKKLRGPENTKVKLGVKRHGTSEILNYTITRGKIPLNSVDVAYMIKPGVGFIKVSKFADTTYSEFIHAIAKLKAQGAKKFIVDLRENGGGFLDQVIKMVNEFLPKNELIVYAKGKSYPRYEARADGTGSCIGMPIVVLIDEFSASASEIFTGAIQDNDRGMVVGRRSFGKGLVQQQFSFPDGSAVRLTVARYHTPSGRCIQKPYKIGDAKDYEKDIYNRFKHGEFDHKDSIHVDDSLKYKTLHGRTVYGGGGIMPDYFVPRDTTGFSPYYNKVANHGYIIQFAFRYTDRHRKSLSHFKDWRKMSNYLSKQDLIDQFTKYAAKKGVKPNEHDIKISKNLILMDIKAYVIRNIIGDDGFFPFLYQDDTTVKKALEVIEKEKK